MLRKRKEAKGKKSIVMTLMRDVQDSAAEKLRMFEKMRAAGGFAKEDPAELEEAEKNAPGACGDGERRGLFGTHTDAGTNAHNPKSPHITIAACRI